MTAFPVWSEEEAPVEKRVQKLEEENKALRDLVKQMQERLDKLEGVKTSEEKEAKDEDKKDGEKKKKKTDDSTKKEEPVEIEAPKKDEKKDQKAEEEITEKKEKKGKGKEWLPSMIGESFRLGGRVQFEFFDSENETLLPSARTEYPEGTFHTDELAIYLDADFKNKIRLYTRYDIEGEDQGLVEAYADFEELPLYSELRVGLQKRFFRPGRYTETYPLTGIAFWRSRVLGATWKTQYDPFYTYLSVTNGTELDDRRLVEDDSARMISDDDTEYDANGNKEVSLGVGLDFDFNQYGRLDLMGFGLTGELSEDDVTYLQTDVPGYGFSTDDDKELAGVNVEYKIDEWDFFAQAIGGRDGEMERFSWFTELSYKFNISGMRYLDSIRPLVRYGELDTNMTPQAYMRNGSLTWDREQWLFAVIAELVNNVNFRAEYALNEEDTGGPGANNNEILFQLELEF
ncbi:MAG: hypothetical protein ACP5I1_04660 [Candidatus Hinthialibacter sp.]